MTNARENSSDADVPLADEAVLRAHAGRLTEIAAEHGITELRFASPGRLVGHVDDERDAFDIAAFEVAAEDELKASVLLFSDSVVNRSGASSDLVTAKAL